MPSSGARSQEEYMRKLLTAVLTFGTYNRYIPPYIYFLKRAYPEAHPVCFIASPLAREEESALNILAREFAFTIIEHRVIPEFSLSGQHASAVRWLLWDARFEEYDGVYIGDVDMFIMPEEISLIDGHMAHCERFGLPFSNVIRPPRLFTPLKNPQTFANTLALKGAECALMCYKNEHIGEKRITGLHFFQPRAYKEYFQKFYTKYFNIITEKQQFIHHKFGFHNEQLLYDFVEDCGMIQKVETQEQNVAAYRPWHGIHIGIFRNMHRSSRHVFDACLTPEQKSFYRHFTNLTGNDALFLDMRQHLAQDILQEIANYAAFMSSHMD